MGEFNGYIAILLHRSGTLSYSFSCNGHIVEGNLKSAIEDGINSDLFVELIHSLCSELKSSLSLQEVVTHPQGKEDAESLQMELRAFLVELHCPHINLTMDMNVLSSYQKRLLVLDYLVSELVASRLNTLRQGKEDVMEIEEDSEVNCNSDLRELPLH